MDDYCCTWWEEEDGTWTTECENAWEVDCNMEHIGMRFCCYCGLPLKKMAYDGDVDDSIYVNGGEG